MPVDKTKVKDQLDALGDFSRFLTSSEIGYLPQILNQGEIVHGITSGIFEAKTWIIVVTDRRLLFLDKKLFVGLTQVDIPLSQISSVTHTAGWFFGEIEVSTSSGAKSIGNVSKKDVVKIANIICGLIQDQSRLRPQRSMAALEEPALSLKSLAEVDIATKPAVKPVIKPLDIASQLERLVILREKGFLTDDEFAKGKAKLLD